MTTRYSVPSKGTIKLVKKHDAWVPQKQGRKTTLEVHGYAIISTLGEGAFAKVKLAKSKKHNCNVAIKVIDKRKAPKDYIYKFLPREIQIMHRLNHPNVVSTVYGVTHQQIRRSFVHVMIFIFMINCFNTMKYY